MQSDMGNHAAASEAAAKALKLDDKDAAAMAVLAVSSARQGKSDDAVKWASAAVRSTSDPGFLRVAGEVLAGAGKQRDALAAFDRGLSAGFDPALAYARASTLESLGDRPAALKAFEDLGAKSPGFKDVASRIAALRK